MDHDGPMSTPSEPSGPSGPDQLREPAFGDAGLGREGYDREAVDAFVLQLRQALRHQPPSMAPYEVADQRFPSVRRHGYEMADVDDYLDHALAVLRTRHGDDALAGLEGHKAEPPEPRPGWFVPVMVLLALVVVAAVVVAVLALR